MIDKLRNDPDKFERMFAAKFIAKYNFEGSREFLEKALLNDGDSDVILLIKDILKEMNQ